VTWVFNGLEELANALLRRAGIDSYPVPVEELALRLGADRVVTRRLEREEGRLELCGSEVVIAASSDASLARRRFTIAHEIGHLIAADPRYELRKLRERNGLRSEERFCDRLAEALLMPAERVRERFSGVPASLATVVACSQAFGVSAAAANLRLSRCTAWSQALLRFTANRHGWQLSAVTGWGPECRDRVGRSRWTDLVLARFAEPGALSRLWLPLDCDEREWFFGAELWGRDGWALALVNPRLRRAIGCGTREISPVGEHHLENLKLFYSLDDIDACILPASISIERKEGSREDEGRFAGQPLGV
jgi:hypothetical protein